MNSLGNLERIFYETRNNKDVNYPMIDADTFAYMVTEASANSSKAICFPYFRSIRERNYLDCYIWDIMLPNGYKRFVIEQGYALADDEEEIFINYLNRDLCVEIAMLEGCIRKVVAEYPQIHLIRYGDWRHTLLHIYYTFHRTGAHEILFKANLDHLAASLSYVDGYNWIGSSPEKILDVQLGMLRALNSYSGARILGSVENRK